jgi:hypothetical protein
MGSFAPLSLLSADILGSITALIYDQDIGALWFCGDIALNRRLENGGVRNFEFNRGCRRPLDLWPWMVSHFRALKSFRFIGWRENKTVAKHSLQQIERSQLESLAPGLIELVFDGEVNLYRRDISLITERFPGLQLIDMPIHPKYLSDNFTSLKFLADLRLKSWGSCKASHLQNLSKTLTKLSLLGITFDDYSVVLPESITDLTFRPLRIHLYDIPAGLQVNLPPHLVNLWFFSFGVWAYKSPLFWPTLPRTISKLELRIHCDAISAELFSFLPSTLLHFQLCPLGGGFFAKMRPEHVLALPAGLEYLDLGLINADEWDQDMMKQGIFPAGLTTLKVLGGWTVETKLPSRLKVLHFQSDFGTYPCALPHSLTELIDVKFQLTVPCSQLPPSLTKLKVALLSSIFQAEKFPATCTNAHLRLIFGNDILKHLPQTLTKLKLHYMYEPYEGVDEETPQWETTFEWSSFLPKTLTHLSVKAFLSDKWFALLDLPRLKELIVFHDVPENIPELIRDKREMVFGTNALNFVPHSVTDLLIQFDQFHIDDLAAMRHHLNLQMITVFSNNAPSMSNSCVWSSLPPKLGRLHLYLTNYEIPHAEITVPGNPGMDVRYLRSRDPRMF